MNERIKSDKVNMWWRSNGCAKVTHWSCCLEEHKDGGLHFHLATKLDRNQGWISSKTHLIDAYGISVHYSNRHYNYYSAWRYVTKSNACYIEREGHPRLDDTEPQTSSASHSRCQRQKRSHGNTTNSEISSAGDEEEDFTQQRHLSGIFPHCCEGFTGQRAWKVQEYYVNRSSKLRENIFIEPTDNYQQHI